jgi:hypothetical protein
MAQRNTEFVALFSKQKMAPLPMIPAFDYCGPLVYTALSSDDDEPDYDVR